MRMSEARTGFCGSVNKRLEMTASSCYIKLFYLHYREMGYITMQYVFCLAILG